jgi:UPF0755 protein
LRKHNIKTAPFLKFLKLIKKIIALTVKGFYNTFHDRKYRFLFLVLIIFIFLGGFYFSSSLLPVKNGKNAQSESVTVIIPQNTTGRKVGEILGQKKLIRSPLVFYIYTRFKGVGGRIGAGAYNLSPSMSMPDIVKRLTEGEPDVIKITVPEGYALRQIAELFDKKEVAVKELFLIEAEQGSFGYSFLEGLQPGPHRLEGYLFPDTYYLSGRTPEHEIIDLMLRRFAQEMESLDYASKAGQAGLTLRSALIIASMVEKEAKVDRERPLIAGVILNRLRAGMPLQIDATIQYALGDYREKLYYKDLQVDSPYNTYLKKGLPPSPIASPGKASLLAAINPEHTNYFYYVAKPDGTHAFAATLAEHNANKEKYQSQ